MHKKLLFIWLLNVFSLCTIKLEAEPWIIPIYTDTNLRILFIADTCIDGDSSSQGKVAHLTPYMHMNSAHTPHRDKVMGYYMHKNTYNPPRDKVAHRVAVANLAAMANLAPYIDTSSAYTPPLSYLARFFSHWLESKEPQNITQPPQNASPEEETPNTTEFIQNATEFIQNAPKGPLKFIARTYINTFKLIAIVLTKRAQYINNAPKNTIELNNIAYSNTIEFRESLPTNTLEFIASVPTNTLKFIAHAATSTIKLNAIAYSHTSELIKNAPKNTLELIASAPTNALKYLQKTGVNPIASISAEYLITQNIKIKGHITRKWTYEEGKRKINHKTSAAIYLRVGEQ